MTLKKTKKFYCFDEKLLEPFWFPRRRIRQKNLKIPAIVTMLSTELLGSMSGPRSQWQKGKGKCLSSLTREVLYMAATKLHNEHLVQVNLTDEHQRCTIKVLHLPGAGCLITSLAEVVGVSVLWGCGVWVYPEVVGVGVPRGCGVWVYP